MKISNPSHKEDISNYLKSFYYADSAWANNNTVDRFDSNTFKYNKKFIDEFDEAYFSIVDYCFNSEFMYNDVRDEKFSIANISKLFSLITPIEQGFVFIVIYDEFMQFLTPYSSSKLSAFLKPSMFDNDDIYHFLKDKFSIHK